MGRKEKVEDWVIVDRLTDIILDNVKGCVVDIGIGASTKVLAYHTKRLGVKHYCCDISPKRCKWAREKLRWPEVYEGKSLDFIKQFLDNPVALVFIDGDHRYKVVIQEVRFFLEKLTPGGVIFLHDTYPKEGYVYEDGQRCGTVYKVRQEMENDNSVWSLTWPYTGFNYGITMLLKKEKNVPFFRR